MDFPGTDHLCILTAMRTKKHIAGWAVLALFLCAGIPDGINPQSKKITEAFFPEVDLAINTPGILKKKGFVNHEEMIAFLADLQRSHAGVMYFDTIGASQNGAPIVAVHLNEGAQTDPLRIWMQGGLHGNEPASTEGMLFFIQQWLEGDSLRAWSDGVELCIIPMTNVDGYEKQDRYSANGLDLNRDHTKVATPEMQQLKQAFHRFNPHVAVDFHEYKPYRKQYAQLSTYGVCGYYDVMFLYSSNLNVPAELRDFTTEHFVAPAKRAVISDGFSTSDYFSSIDHHGDIHLKMGSLNARSSATAYALNNTVSTLIEVRGVGIEKTSFKRRTFITYQVACSYLRSAFEHRAEVFATIAATQPTRDSAVALSEKITAPQSVYFIDLDRQERVQMEMMVEDAASVYPTLQRAPALAYALLDPQSEWKEKLDVLGIHYRLTSRDTTLTAERYTVAEYVRDSYPYEGVLPQRVQARTDRSERTLPAGSLWIPLDQPKGRLVVELLEPERPNGWIYFDIIHTAPGDKLPVWRILNTNF